MAPAPFSPAETTAIVFIAGFAIQQALQIIDPIVVWIIQGVKKSRSTNDLPGGMSEGDFKKAIMALLSFGMGAVGVWLTGIRLLKLLGDYSDPGDFLITALVLGSGTEAVNTVIKYLGYVKDARKPPAEVEIAVVPPSASVQKSTTFRFGSSVKNTSDTRVKWELLHGNGGQLDSSGLYTAPAIAGAYQIRATSEADPTKYAVATVTVA